MQPLSISSFPRAVLHIDGDAFFASCEQAMNEKLRGKPVVTGKERGIASSMSYEAKARGIKRAMRLSEIKKLCPECIILPSDYEAYSLFSVRMFDIVRRYTSVVEEYSIDECFADLTGMRRPLRKTYKEICTSVQRDLETELGFTFSIGLAPTKTLAKVASNWNKPNGLTLIPGNQAHQFLKKLPVNKVWGIGSQTSCFFSSLGIMTALDFAVRTQTWVYENLDKPLRETWHELRGELVHPVSTGGKEEYKSISKTKTFTPPSKDPSYVLAQLSKNIENACIKARRHRLRTNRVSFYLKQQDFRRSGIQCDLDRYIQTPDVLTDVAEKYFPRFFRPNTPYRATGVVLHNLTSQHNQADLFGATAEVEKSERLFDVIDNLDTKYGKHTVFLGSSFNAVTRKAHSNDRGDIPKRYKQKIKGETKRKHLNLPMLGEVR